MPLRTAGAGLAALLLQKYFFLLCSSRLAAACSGKKKNLCSQAYNSRHTWATLYPHERRASIAETPTKRPPRVPVTSWVLSNSSAPRWTFRRSRINYAYRFLGWQQHARGFFWYLALLLVHFYWLGRRSSAWTQACIQEADFSLQLLQICALPGNECLLNVCQVQPRKMWTFQLCFRRWYLIINIFTSFNKNTAGLTKQTVNYKHINLKLR